MNLKALACYATVLLVPLTLNAQENQSSVFDLVTECDILAAHPDDVNRFADGVLDEDIIPALAEIACTKALQEDGDSARLHFQLGRALLVKGSFNEARNSFVRAAQKGYGPAYSYVGHFFRDGVTLDQDLSKAIQNYEAAIKAGFLTAQADIDALIFDKNRYANDWVDDLVRGQAQASATPGASERIGRIQRSYIYAFSNALDELCGVEYPRAAMLNPYDFRFPADWSPELDEDVLVAIQNDIGSADAARFVERHTCVGPITDRLITNLVKFYTY